MATWPPAKSCLVLLDNDIMAAKYEGHSDDDVVTFFFSQRILKPLQATEDVTRIMIKTWKS